VARTAVDAAEFFYQQGLAAYRAQNYSQAFEGFTSAVALNGAHAAARDQLERTGERLQRETEAILLDWRRQFEAGEYAGARESYRRLRALNVRGRTEADLDRLEARYRESLSRVVESWNRACANRDLTAMEALEREAGLLRPDPAVGDDLVAQMTCEVQDCLPMPPELAIRRITSRVSPDIPATGLASGTVVRARLRIDENGAAAVSSIDGGDAAVRRSIRAAVGQWTFVPAVIGGEGHCLETEFSFAVPR
jgi:tetratricopeptide (TPR) repeat protein